MMQTEEEMKKMRKTKKEIEDKIVEEEKKNAADEAAKKEEEAEEAAEKATKAEEKASLDPYLFAWFREDIGVPGQHAVEKLRKSRTQPEQPGGLPKDPMMAPRGPQARRAFPGRGWQTCRRVEPATVGGVCNGFSASAL